VAELQASDVQSLKQPMINKMDFCNIQTVSWQ